LESERPDALFRDPFARRLAGERGRAIAETLKKGPLSWSLAVRTRVFDDLIVDVVTRRRVKTVLCLGAGLDARPYRLSLPRDVRWIDSDLPGISSAKADALSADPASCLVERVPLDLADRSRRREVFAGLNAREDPVLVVTEGVLVYLDETEVAGLAAELREAFPKGMWLVENIAPEILARQRRTWKRHLAVGNAEHKFAPTTGLDFFRARGWPPTVTKSLLDESVRLRREMPLARLLRPLERLFPGRRDRFRNAVVYALLEAAP
jgi:methyltransferase (TIGR00027 family)